MAKTKKKASDKAKKSLLNTIFNSILVLIAVLLGTASLFTAFGTKSIDNTIYAGGSAFVTATSDAKDVQVADIPTLIPTPIEVFTLNKLGSVNKPYEAYKNPTHHNGTYFTVVQNGYYFQAFIGLNLVNVINNKVVNDNVHVSFLINGSISEDYKTVNIASASIKVKNTLKFADYVAYLNIPIGIINNMLRDEFKTIEIDNVKDLEFLNSYISVGEDDKLLIQPKRDLLHTTSIIVKALNSLNESKRNQTYNLELSELFNIYKVSNNSITQADSDTKISMLTYHLAKSSADYYESGFWIFTTKNYYYDEIEKAVKSDAILNINY